jgi:hypothetical protein
MGQGNTVAATVSTGAPAPPATVDDCKNLGNANEERREELEKKTADKSLVGEDGGGEGTTISSGSVGTDTCSAHSNQKAYEKCTETLVQGGAMGDRHSGKSGLSCPPAPPYKHPDPSAQKSGHAEARIMDHLGNAGKMKPGSTAAFNIDWRKSSGKRSKLPCKNCHEMICDNSKEPQPKEVTKEHCPPTANNRKKLKAMMGEVK